MTQLLHSLALAYCRFAHPRGYPINGYSRCMVCQCRIPVPWDAQQQPVAQRARALRIAKAEVGRG